MFTEGYWYVFLFLEDFLLHKIPHLKVNYNVCTTNNGITKVIYFFKQL